MSGFNGPPEFSGQPGDGDDPFSAMFGAGFDPSQMGAAFTQLGAMLSYEGPVNWKLASDTAQAALAQHPDPSVSAADRSAIDEAVRLAELWLDPATIYPASGAAAASWTRAQWLDQTFEGWKGLVEPLASRAGEAMGAMLPQGMPEEAAAMAGPLAGMFKQLGGAMFGAQLGQGLANLSQDVLGASDVGVPLTANGAAALVPANVNAFGEGLGVPLDQVRLYLALREVAHQRLFAHVPWLRGTIVGAVEDYARGMRVDTSALEQAMGSLDVSDPQAIQSADASTSLPSASALRETLRRRRASGGPAEQTFATLVGLELRPRRLRDAAALWASLA